MYSLMCKSGFARRRVNSTLPVRTAWEREHVLVVCELLRGGSPASQLYSATAPSAVPWGTRHKSRKSPALRHHCIIQIGIQQGPRNSLRISAEVSFISEINLGPVTHPIKNRQGRSALTAAWTLLAWNAAVTEQLWFSYVGSWRSVLIPRS